MWNYYRDEPSNPFSTNSESFKYNTSITGNTYNVGAGEDDDDAENIGKNETEIFIPLKHLINFWRTVNVPLKVTSTKKLFFVIVINEFEDLKKK